LLLVILIITLGFYRDYIFVNINAQLDYLQGRFHYYTHPYLGVLNKLTESELYQLKWFLTLFVTLLYLSISSLVLLVLFRNKKPVLWLVYFYLSVFILAGVCYLLGHNFNFAAKGYRFARILMGFIQSPIPLMIVILGVILDTKKQNSIN